MSTRADTGLGGAFGALTARVQPLRARSEIWFAGRSERERQILVAGGITVFIALFIVLVWQPLADARAEASAEIARLDQLDSRIRAAGPALSAAPANAAMPLQNALTESAAAFGIDINRIDPGPDQTGIVIDRVPFEQLILWMDLMRRDYGIGVEEVSMERLAEPGTVSVRMTVAR